MVSLPEGIHAHGVVAAVRPSWLCVGGAILGEPLGSNTEVGRGTKDREIFRVEAEPERKHFEVR